MSRAVFLVVAFTALLIAVPASAAHAATITASYEAGHTDVLINGYGTPGLGAFTLHDGADDLIAFCVEADASHSWAIDAYRIVDAAVRSSQLDYLVWAYARGLLGTDDDTATAVAALAWFYAGATRGLGVPVWADGARAFAPVSPTTPQRWDELQRYSSSFPVGLRGGGVDLDGAERRVHELALEADARRGPWEVSEIRVEGDDLVVDVIGPAGPIAGAEVRFETRVAGSSTTVVTAQTSTSGTARSPGGRVPGTTVDVSVEGPGMHREWDGAGDVQRLVTPTTATLVRTIAVPPDQAYVRVVKRSTDPTIGVAGGVFELRDAHGSTVARLTSPSDGSMDVGPIDTVAHPPPYVVHEIAPPPGLRESPEQVAVPVPVSTDAHAPTVVEITNEPDPRPIVVRKVVDPPDLGPADHSGFTFSVLRVADDRDMGTLVTGPDGNTPEFPVTVGTFEVCETTVPPWAAGLVDGGCRTVEVGPSGGPTIVDYVNRAQIPEIETAVRDAVDGDQHLPSGGGRLVDLVTYVNLVPGTEYTIEGQVYDVGPDGAVEPTGLVGRTAFVPDSANGTVEVSFDVAASFAGTTGVVVERVLVGDRVVAAHEDPHDQAQTFDVAPPPATTAVVASSIAPSTSPSSTGRALPDAGSGTDAMVDAAVLATTSGLVLMSLGLGARRRR